jgi:hypothetical protein
MKTKSIRARDIASFPLLTKLDFTQYGETANSPKFKSAELLFFAAINFLILERNRFSLEHVTHSQKTTWQSFIRNFEKSVATGDASLWRVLADIIETTKSHPKGVKPGWGFVGAQIGAADAFKMPRPTKNKLRLDLEHFLGRKVDRTEVKRFCKYMELPATKGKPGRPRKQIKRDR